MEFDEMIKQAGARAREKGWYNGLFRHGGKKALCHKLIDEVQELFEAEPAEEFDKDSEESELADVVICCLAFADIYGIDIKQALAEKIEYNKTRK